MSKQKTYDDIRTALVASIEAANKAMNIQPQDMTIWETWLIGSGINRVCRAIQKELDRIPTE